MIGTLALIASNLAPAAPAGSPVAAVRSDAVQGDAVQGDAVQGAPGREGEGQDGGGITLDLFTPEGAVDADPIAETTIGMRVEVRELLIPGSDLVPKPVDDPGRADVILRVQGTYNHGENRRYDLEITPFVAGEIDLRDHLVRVDGSSMSDVPPLIVVVDSVRDDPEAVQPPPDPDVADPEGLGGYWRLVAAGGILWFLGLFALVVVGRRPRPREESAPAARPRTLAERLHPLVLGARDGSLAPAERAELERLVLAHWRARRGLTGATVAEAISALRRDPEAGPLLLKLEEWLHRPGGAERAADEEIRRLLEPFADAPASTDGGGEGRGGAR